MSPFDSSSGSPIPTVDDALNDAHGVDPCCDHCNEAMQREPWRSALIKEECLFETRVSNYMAGSALSWD